MAKRFLSKFSEFLRLSYRKKAYKNGKTELNSRVTYPKSIF